MTETIETANEDSTRVSIRVQGQRRLPRPGPLAAFDPAEHARVFEALFREPAEPLSLGRYVVLGKLGSGGMGRVLEAFDRTLDRRVALKVLHHDLGREHTARLMREARALAKLSHPNVVQVYEASEADGQAFIAMELVQGRTLGEWLAKDPRPRWRECVRVYLQAGAGLAAAHARGLVHRDFKPGNAVIDPDGRVRVLDFGLARRASDVASETTRPEPRSQGSSLEPSLTETGAVMGTPAYMAPEQLRGHEADARSDQFGFCVALYEALHGERPFEGRSLEALTESVLSGRRRPVPRGLEVPAQLRKVVLRGLAVEPNERWPSMEALLAELRRMVSPRRRGVSMLGLGVVGLAALGLGLARHAEVGRRCEGARAQLQGVWDEDRRRAVEAAILGTGVSYAADTWSRVEPRLDEYADAWAEAHTEICEATSVRQEQSTTVMDLRMACLRERRTALGEAVDVMAQADGTRVEHAAELVASLPVLSRCDDVEALAAELPPPEDPEVAAQVQTLRQQLVHARALREAGVFAEALDATEALVHRAELLAYAPLLAEALLERGRVRDFMSRYAEAEQDMERAYLMAAEHGHDGVEARAVIGLTWVVGYRQSRHKEALQWGRTALALAKGPYVEPEVEALALKAVGTVLSEQGKSDEALTHLQRALVIAQEALGPRHPDVAVVLFYIGVVLVSEGRWEEAMPHWLRALTIHEEVLGPRHPNLADSLLTAGLLRMQRGEPEEALAYYERALAIGEEAYGPDSLNISNAIDLMGDALWSQGKEEEARTHYERASSITEKTLGSLHPDFAYSLSKLATFALEMRDFDTAREHAERAVSILEAAETAPLRLAQARFLLARVLAPEPSQRSRARALAQQARDAYAEVAGWGQELEMTDAWLAEHPL